MRLNYNEELNKLMNPYLENLLKNKANLHPELIPLFNLIIEDFDREGRYGLFEEKIEPLLEEIIRNERIQSITHLFDGKLKELLRYTLGDEYASLFHTYLQLQSRCPYTSGYSRRSQRCAAPGVHLSNIRYTWIEFLKLRATGFSETAVLNEGNTPEQIEQNRDCLNSAAWIAAQIAQGNQTVIEYIRQVMTSENNANQLKREHLAAIAKSGHRELLELEGKLLLAAKLQEGLRQSIIETIDEGCTESYLYMLSVICDNGLQRFAAVKRGIAVATGIGEMASERITNKIIDLIRSFLNDPKLARNALQSKDTLELYLALWSIGFYNVDEIKALVSGVIKKGTKHQVQTLLYFLRCTQSSCMNHHISKEAFEKWHKDPSVVVAILPLYLNDVYLSRYRMDEDTPELKEYFDNSQEASRHYEYLKLLSLSVSAEEHYSPFVFPWGVATLTRSDIICRMMYIAWMTNDKILKDDLCKFLPVLDTYQRANCIEMVLSSPTSNIQQTCVLQALGDRSVDVRGSAYNVLTEMNLTSEQYRSIEELLRFKYSEMRINAINLLMKQPKEQLADSVRRLLADKVAERRLAGLDMIKNIRNVEHLKDIYGELIVSVKEIIKPNAKEKVLIESLIGNGQENSETTNYTKENGFGLYNPALDVTLPPVKSDTGFEKKKAFQFILSGMAKATFEKLNKYIETYKDEEFKSEYGEARLVGNTVTLGWYREGGLDKLALPELWKAFYEKEIGSYDKLLMMQFMLTSTGSPTEAIDTDDDEEDEEEEDTQSSLNTFEPIINQMYAGITYRGLQKGLRDLPYYDQMESIINALAHDYRDEAIYQKLSINMLLQLLPLLNTQNIFRQHLNKRTWLSDKQKYGEKLMVYPIHDNKFVNFWLDTPQKPIENALFARYFTVRYQLYKLTNYMEHTPELEEDEPYMRSMDFARGWLLGMIPDGEIYREMVGRIKSPNRVEGITMVLFDGYRNSYERKEFDDFKDFDFSSFRPLAQNVIDRILEIELKRGDSETQVTRLATKLRRVYGAEVLIRILQAFGKDTFVRDSYNSNNTKRGVLSCLLQACHPLPTDTGKLLKKIAREAEISDERLVEAAMFSPQWMEFAEEATGWKGLTSAAYYFHAHTSVSCDDKTKAIIARYTPIDAADLCEGAFDIDWFKDAYKSIGKERFEVIYNSAKYISSSNSHTRARKFADAANGKLKAAEVKKEIIAKRNKDLLMSYGLIPLGKKADKELLERYQYLQKFLKESKEFGAQRQESEKKAVNIALQNLALGAGYGDITRLTWSMETELIKELLPYLTPKKVEGVEVYVSISDNGKSEIKQAKDGKELNSLPVKLKKHPYIEELKTVHKKLKDQYTRSRTMLEQAMEDCTRFEEKELRKLMQNPVIWPLLKNLIFTCNEQIGFYSDGQLIATDGVCISLKANDELRIAHPTDLYISGHWHMFQKLLFDKEIRQSFKQVFRELYVPTPEEKEATQSRRYAGNQIQPQKTVAVLKGRRWIADYEGGLQKVYYKENIIATIYAMADWFSPADIEAPTLEYVCFYNRRNYKLMKISEIPTIVFSEVMRDVDLAVSVAHAGSVDPETSHSTIEMRRVLVELTMPLFRFNNVTVKGSFAYIEGKLGKYNIHLGSGVIHQEGGAQIAVLPVHSQNRGRLFLPFVDEDPKTAEILTKIIFFADDEKIKDPSILNQIKRTSNK